MQRRLCNYQLSVSLLCHRVFATVCKSVDLGQYYDDI